MATAQQAAMSTIDQIEDTLAALSKMLEQEKADILKADWPAVGTLGYVDVKLHEVEDFWSGRQNEA